MLRCDPEPVGSLATSRLVTYPTVGRVETILVEQPGAGWNQIASWMERVGGIADNFMRLRLAPQGLDSNGKSRAPQEILKSRVVTKAVTRKRISDGTGHVRVSSLDGLQ
jgi:hypothetical protein